MAQHVDTPRAAAPSAARHAAMQRIDTCRKWRLLQRNAKRKLLRSDSRRTACMTETQRDKPWLFRTYAGHSTAAGIERALSRQPRQGADRACRSPSTCRRRPATTATTNWRGARSARSACPIAHLGDMRDALRRHPARPDEHLDDDQRHRARGCSRSTSPWPRSRARTSPRLQGTVQNDIIKEYLSRGHLYLPAASPRLRMITDVAA